MSKATAISLLLAIAGLAGSVITYKTHKVWAYGCVSVFVLATIVAIHLQSEEQYEISGNDAISVGRLEPGPWYSLHLPLRTSCANEVPQNAVKLFLGSFLVFTTDFEKVLQIGNSYLTIRTLPNGMIGMDLRLDSVDGGEIIKIHNNIFEINPQQTMRMLQPDRYELQVFDLLNREILYIRFVNPREIYLTGTFAEDKEYPLTIKDEEIDTIGGALHSGCATGALGGWVFSDRQH